MAYSKIVLNGETLMDVTEDTVDSGNLLSGETATKNSGVKVTGSLSPVTDVTVNGTSVVTSGVAAVTVPDVSGKIDTAGTGLSKSSTTLNHSNSITAQTTQAVYPIKIDAQGHINAYGSAVTVPTVTDTYSGTSSNGMSGKAVKSAIDALDGTVTGSAGSGKTLTAFSQTDGKVSATFGDISITKSQVSDFPTIPAKNIWYATCSTSASTSTKEATTTSGDFTLENGNMVRIKMADSNSSTAPWLSVDSGTAKSLCYYGQTQGSYGWVAGEVIDVVYDQSNDCFVMSEGGHATTTNWGVIKLSDSTSSTSTTLGATANAVRTAYNVGQSAPATSAHAKFDSDAHMNSTDMSSEDVTTFVNGLAINGGGMEIISRSFTVTAKSATYYEETIDIGVTGYTPLSVGWSANQVNTNIYALYFVNNSTLFVGRSLVSGGQLSSNTVTFTVTYISI